MKFSIVTPVTYDRDGADELRMPRYSMFLRCANSLLTQTYRDFEWVVVDDICAPAVTREILPQDIPDVQIIRLPEKSGRIIARNAGMKAANGEWICWLDADDEYASTYLEMVENAIQLYPDTKIFNFDHLMFGYDYHPYVREFINMEVQGDKPFRSGNVGAGSFVFHRSVYEDIGPLPEKGIWDLAHWAVEAYPEIAPFYWNEQKQDYDSLGNPWGEDWLYFYMMTRKYQAKKLNAAPYYVHSRWGHRLPGSPDYTKDPGSKPSYDPNNR